MQLNPMDCNDTTKKVEMVRAHAETARRHTSKNSLQRSDWETNQKQKGGQKLTWHQVITRDLNTCTINIDLKKAITLSQDRDLYNEMVVNRVMAKAVDNYLPEDRDPE